MQLCCCGLAERARSRGGGCLHWWLPTVTAQKHCALTSSSIWKPQQPTSTELTTVRSFSPIYILWMLKSAYLYHRVKLMFYILCLCGECVNCTSVRPMTAHYLLFCILIGSFVVQMQQPCACKTSGRHSSMEDAKTFPSGRRCRHWL